ncbi:helix-turn-helix transcriptional regulator [Parafrigoribacterium soli]|uniref:helix-turn-helix transcriptional regulator n=1 Tax=Parafrigoribacterium soli TaxID=3144663 RepID=UPI0032EB1A61
MTRSRIEALWGGLPVVARDGIIALLLFGISLVPLGVRGLELGELSRTAPAWTGPAFAAVITLPLTLRRFVPALALALSGAGYAASELTAANVGLGGLGLLLAIYSVAAFQRRYRAWVGAAVAIGYVALAITLSRSGSTQALLDWFTFAAVLALPWILGELVRRRRAQDDQRQRLLVEEALRKAGFAPTAQHPDAAPADTDAAPPPIATGMGEVSPRAEPAASDILTAREFEVLQLLARGLSNSEIASEMFVTRETVKTYVSRLLSKLGLRDRTQAALFAHRNGIAE